MDFDNSIFRQSGILYWKPDLRTGKNGKTEIDFFTSDESSEYTIIVEGIASDGSTGFSFSSFNVK